MPWIRKKPLLVMPYQNTDLLMPAYSASSLLGSRDFGCAQFECLVAFFNVCQVLAADTGSASESLILALDHGVAALDSMLSRQRRTSAWGVSGDEMQTIRTALDVCHTLFTRQTRPAIEAAYRRTLALLDQMKQAGLERVEFQGQGLTSLEMATAMATSSAHLRSQK